MNTKNYFKFIIFHHSTLCNTFWWTLSRHFTSGLKKRATNEKRKPNETLNELELFILNLVAEPTYLIKLCTFLLMQGFSIISMTYLLQNKECNFPSWFHVWLNKLNPLNQINIIRWKWNEFLIINIWTSISIKGNTRNMLWKLFHKRCNLSLRN